MGAENAANLPAVVEEEPRNFFDRTLDKLLSAWRGIAGESEAREPADVRKLRARIRDCLGGKGGEVSARARTAALGYDYLQLDQTGRETFLRILAEDFDADYKAVDAAAGQLLDASGKQAKREASIALARAMESPARRLLTQFNTLPDGVKFLVDMRAELLPLARQDPAFVALLDDLTSLLRSWFDIGFLNLEVINWDSPASLLEKLIAYEAVHEIHDWTDLKNRLDSDRRCFAYMHPRMPEEPIIFVEVALTKGIAGNIQTLLDPDAPLLDPEDADTAVFYSISNAQKGLAGIGFGNFLIKRVVQELLKEFPHLSTFATLSPIPGFRKWLVDQPLDGLLTAAEKKALPKRVDGGQHPEALTRNPDWFRNKSLARALEKPMTRLCARYLLTEKKGSGRVVDPVEHFHLSNGARVERINWLGDTSANGMRQSAGLMVNYLYDLDHIDDNHEAYTGEGKVAAASALKTLAKRS